MTNKEIQAVRERIRWTDKGAYSDYQVSSYYRQDVPKLLDELTAYEMRLGNAHLHHDHIQKERNDWKAESERLQAKIDDIDRYGTLNEQDWMDEAKRLQEENEFLRFQRESLENQLQHYRGYE